jgi:hypothetical protein
MAKKNTDVVNAPTSEEILKEMNDKPLISTSGINEVNDLLSGYTEKVIIDTPSAQDAEKKKRGRPKKGEQDKTPQGTFSDPNVMPENPIISGSLMVLLIDLILPNVICMINNKVSKKKIKANLLMMTDEQRKQLEPVADQVAKEMSLKANPLTVLIVSMIGIYGVNLMMLKSE